MSLLKLLTKSQAKVLQVSGGCHNCSRKRVDYVPSKLAKGGQVLFMGETPTKNDQENGEPLSGTSGSILRRMAEEYRIPTPWSFTYTVHCRVPENGKPKPKEVSCCLSQFGLDEMKSYPIVVLVGSVALQAVFPKAKADHFRGNFARHPDFPGQRFYAIYHPADVARNPRLEEEFRQQLERLGRVARGEEAAQQWVKVRGPGALEALKKMLKSPLLSLDLETNRLESWVEGGKIKSFACTADGKTVVSAAENEAHFEACMRLIAEYVTKTEKSVVGAHISFDLEWIEREYKVIVRCQIIHDVGIEYYHFKQYKMPSLKELVARELDGYRYLIHNPHEMQDSELLLDYNSEDVIYPLKLFIKAMKGMKPKTRDLCGRVLGPAELVLGRMSATGIYLREDYRKQMAEEYGDRRRAVIKAWKDEDPEFVPTEHESGDGLIKYLFDIRKLPVLERTGEGKPVTDKSILKQLARDGHNIVRHRLALSEIDKIESTYITPYGKIAWADSRIRSHYPLNWTDSGRSSSRSPNLQNIPRKKEIRNLFGAPPGSILLESDLSQIEFRIMVCLARDENGIAGYLRGDDAHTTTARNASGNPTPTKEQRSQAKPINFGFLYGAHWKMVQQLVADDYGVIWTDEEAENFRNLFMGTYPALPVYHDTCAKKLIANQGWFESSVGHIYRYEDWNHPDRKKADHARRAALNAEAQGPAAQLCMYIMVLARRMLDERGFQSVKFVNHVHDSVMTEIPNPGWVEDVVATIEEAKNEAYKWVQDWFIVPLVMEHSVGESWGALKEIKVA